MDLNATDSSMMESSNGTEEWGEVPNKEAFVAVFCVFCFFGIVGNGSLMFLVIRFPHLRTMPNILMINLTFGDLLYIVASLPDIIRYELVIPQSIETVVMCKFIKFLPGFAMGVCVYSMMALSVERYCAIVRGLEMRSVRTSRRVMGAMIFIWGMTFLVTAPVLVSAGFLYPEYPNQFCSDMKPGDAGSIAYYSIHITFLYILPLVTMGFCYISISYQLIQGARESTPNSRSNTNYEARKRLAIAIIVMAAFFAIFWLPAGIYSLYSQVNYEKIFNMTDSRQIALHHSFRRLSRVFAYTNSCFNPWILYFISTTHRRAVARCFFCCCGSKGAEENGSYRMVRMRTNGRTVTTYHSYSSESGRGNRITKPEDI